MSIPKNHLDYGNEIQTPTGIDPLLFDDSMSKMRSRDTWISETLTSLLTTHTNNAFRGLRQIYHHRV